MLAVTDLSSPMLSHPQGHHCSLLCVLASLPFSVLIQTCANMFSHIIFLLFQQNCDSKYLINCFIHNQYTVDIPYPPHPSVYSFIIFHSVDVT